MGIIKSKTKKKKYKRKKSKSKKKRNFFLHSGGYNQVRGKELYQENQLIKEYEKYFIELENLVNEREEKNNFERISLEEDEKKEFYKQVTNYNNNILKLSQQLWKPFWKKSGKNHTESSFLTLKDSTIYLVMDKYKEKINMQIYSIIKNENYQIYSNTTKYLPVVKKILSTCKDELKKSFTISNFNESNILVLKSYDNDPHGLYIPPNLKIQIDGTVLVLKTRPAFLEIAIMKLFNDINSKNSSTIKLPYYKIITCGSFSLWEFIDGETINGDYQNNAEGSLNHDVKNKEKAKKNLVFLNTVARSIGLTDLHYENVILHDDMFYPIDLEIIHQGSVTGLYGHKEGEIMKLDSATQKMIDIFKTNVVHLPNRHIPISTADLYNFIFSDENTVDNLIERFLKNTPNYQNINIPILKKYFLLCQQKKFIPYFLEWERKLYIKDLENNDLIIQISI
jgi:hypothetical protein